SMRPGVTSAPRASMRRPVSALVRADAVGPIHAMRPPSIDSAAFSRIEKRPSRIVAMRALTTVVRAMAAMIRPMPSLLAADRLVRLLEPEDIEAISCQLYIEMLKHGYTTAAEFHYLHNDPSGKPYEDRAELAHAVVGAASAAGIALTLLPVLYAHGGFGHKVLSPAQRRFQGDPAAIVEILRAVADFHLPAPLLRLGIAPHSARAIDALILTELVDAANKLDATMPIHMHVSEQTGEVAECLDTHGVTPLAWVSDLVPPDPRWCFIHATHITALE